MDVTISIIINNPKEMEILKLFFQNKSFKVINTKPDYPGFLQINQYNPACIIIELPKNHLELLHFVDIVRKNKRTASIPVIGYGNHTDTREIKGFISRGFTAYICRPLNTKQLMEHIQGYVHDKQTAAKTSSTGSVPESIKDILLSDTVSGEEKIEKTIESIGKLMAFPFTLEKVISVTKNRDSDARDLAKAIEIDPVICSTILKITNSVFFASRDKRISDIKAAIIRLGFQEVKNIALSLSAVKLFNAESQSCGFNRVNFWYHSLATAVIAEKLVKSTRSPHTSEAFLAGLLHDFGVLILDEYFHEIFNKILDQTTAQASCFAAEERKLLGINSGEIVARLFEKWKMPKVIVSVIKKQQISDTLEAEDPDSVLVKAVTLADCMAKSLQIGRECDLFVTPIKNNQYPCIINDCFFEDIFSQINMYSSFLNLSEKRFSYKEKQKSAPPHYFIVNQDTWFFDPVEHFLKSRGADVIKENNVEKIVNQHISPDVLIVNTKEGDPVTAVEPYLHCIKKDQIDPDNPQDMPHVPVIVLCDAPLSLPDTIQNKSVVQITHGFDLRVIDYVLSCFQQNIPVDISRKTVDTNTEYNEECRSQRSAPEKLMISCRIVESNIIVLDLHGSLRMCDIAGLKTELFEILKLTHQHIAINFKYLDIIDSMLIGLLINFYKQLISQQSKLCFINVYDDVLETFVSTNLNKIITILKDEEELIAFFKAQQG